MFKYLSICLAFVALAAGPACAQKQEAILQYVDVPDAGFNLVLATPKPGAGVLPDLGNTPEAVVVHLRGGALAVAFEDAGEMMRALTVLQSPAIDFHVQNGRGPLQSVALYIVPKVLGLPSGGEMMTLQELENFRWQTVVAGSDPDADHGAEIPLMQASGRP